MGAPQNVEVPLCLFYISITSLFPYHNHLKPQCHKEVRPLVLHQISGFFLMYFLVTIGKSIYRVLGRFQILMRSFLHSALLIPHCFIQRFFKAPGEVVQEIIHFFQVELF